MARVDKSLNRVSDDEDSLESIPGVGPATEEGRAAALREGVLLRRMRPLEEGESIRGKLLGRGAPLDRKESPDGEERAPLETWDIDVGNGIRVGILDCHQLKAELPPLIGRNVYIERGKKKSVKDRMVNQFLVFDLDAKRLQAESDAQPTLVGVA
jgi:hypothetical protein